MKKKPLIILILFSLLTVGAALWQGYEAATLNSRLDEIDRKAQINRLLELSLPRVQAELDRLLTEERNKMAPAPDFSLAIYPMPKGGKADFNCGYFLLTPGALLVPPGEEDFGHVLSSATVVMNTMRRKAFNPSAPIYDPTKPSNYDPRTHLPVFGVYEANDPDFSEPMEAKGKPGPFFAWNHKKNLVYMRSIPTTHGCAAEGFIIDADKLATHLLPKVEPGLREAGIDFVRPGENANLSPLPLILRPGDAVELPDSEARKDAMHGTVAATWLITLISIGIIFGLLAFYTRMERRRSDFVSAVTHELRTPLTSFALITDLLRRKNTPADKIEEYHETLYHETRRLAHLVENVLSFARLSRGKVRGRCDSGLCRELLDKAFSKIIGQLSDAGFKTHITHDKRCDMVTLHTDLLSLEQILTNLADNAVKYAATAATPTINISMVRTHNMLGIRFTDNGPGIPEELQKSLFRPFSRSARAEQGRKPGVGLGLALARDMARSIGGELVLEKSSDAGSTFLLTLPIGDKVS